ncbi:MAG: hypothetical protein INR69_12595 [Mucilaginibacter polytrichastri]|nr:hypothetical protein [Mucilaginibacter polytrichastri]
MKRTLTFLKRPSAALAVCALVLGTLSSCEKTTDPGEPGMDPDVTPSVYSDMEYTSQSASLTGPRNYMLSASIGSKAYFLGGYEGEVIPPVSGKIDIYDAETFTWSSKTLPGADNYYRLDTDSPIQVVGSHVYFVKYFTYPGPPAPEKLRAYNLETGATTMITLNTPRLVEAVAQAGSKVFLSGGISSFYEPPMASQFVNEIYDMNTGETTTIADKDTTIAYTNAAGLGDKIYLTGFDYSKKESGNVFRVFNTTTGKFSSIAVPGAAQVRLYGTADGKVILSGNGKLHIYDPQTNQFSETAVPNPDLGERGFTPAGNLLIFAGGSANKSGALSDAVDVYNLRTNTWSTKKLGEKKSAVAAAVAGDLVLVAGGSTSLSTATNKVEFFKLKSAE